MSLSLIDWVSGPGIQQVKGGAGITRLATGDGLPRLYQRHVEPQILQARHIANIVGYTIYGSYGITDN